MKRGLINEDIQKMMNLINYNRGKTLTENRQTNNRQQLNEFVTPAHLAAAGLGFLLSGPLKSLGNTLLSSAKSAGQTMMTLLGRSANSPAVNAILNSTSYNKFFVALNKLEEEFGVRKGFLSGKIGRISKSTAKSYADSLYEAMDGIGTTESTIYRIYDEVITLISAMRISDQYGVRDGESLTQWITGEGEYNEVARRLAGKPFLTFDGTRYTSLEDAMVAMLAALKEESTMQELKQEAQDREGDWEKNFPCVVNYPKSQQKTRNDGTTYYVIDGEMYFNNGRKQDKSGAMVNYSCDDEIFKNQDLGKLFEDYPCVVAETKNQSNKVEHPYKGNVNQVYITLENGDVMLVDTSGKYVARVGGQKSEGTIECPDDFKISGDEELTLSEGYYLFEQSFGGITLKPSTPSSGVASDETSSSSSSSSRRTSATAEQIELAKAYREWANSTDELSKKYGKNSKFDLDKTTSNPYNNYFLRSYEAGKAEYEASLASGDVASDEDKASGKEAGEKVTPQEETQIDRVAMEKEGVDPETIDDEIQQLQQAISQQPTKDQCKDLIATAAAGIKMGVTLTDTSSLEQCYNSYNFGVGKGSLKVKKHYGLKGKGN